MKKLLLGFAIYGLFLVSADVQASIIYDNGCRGTAYSTVTGHRCGKVLGEALDTTATLETKTDVSDSKTLGTNEDISGNVKKSITVISPNGGEIYQNGQQVTVKWTSKNIPVDTLLEVNIYSSNPMLFGFLAPDGTPNDGIETFTLNSLPNGSNYIIIVGVPEAGLNNSALSVKDESDKPFTIDDSGESTCINSPRQSITVTSPNGGESYTPGQQISINWKSCRISSNTRMRIDLLMKRPNGTTVTRLLKNNTLNDGTEIVTLPTNVNWSQMIYGNNFKVRIRKSNSNTPQDLSDAQFSIDNSLASVTVATASNTPPSQTILVDDYASTLDVKLLKLNISAKGSDLTLKKFPVNIVSGVNISSVLDKVTLYRDGDIIDSVDGSTGRDIVGGVITNNPCTTSCGFIFSNIFSVLNTIPAGTTANFNISVDIKALHGNYPNGFGLTSSVSNGDIILPEHFSILDSNGNELGVSQRSGFAQGQTQLFIAD